MEYTIVINSLLTKEEVEELFQRFFHDSLEVKRVVMGDATDSDAVEKIVWKREDLEAALERREIPATKENVDILEANLGYLHEGSVEAGWEIIDTIVENLKYDKAFQVDDDNEEE